MDELIDRVLTKRRKAKVEKEEKLAIMEGAADMEDSGKVEESKRSRSPSPQGFEERKPVVRPKGEYW